MTCPLTKLAKWLVPNFPSICLLSGILLLRCRPWGYLLTSVGLTKFMTLGIFVSLMGLNMARVGAPDNAALVGIFGALALLPIVMTVILFRNISE